MFENITPLQAGSTSADILEFMQIIDEYCPGMHSVPTRTFKGHAGSKSH